jgi:hypothetical protein
MNLLRTYSHWNVRNFARFVVVIFYIGMVLFVLSGCQHCPPVGPAPVNTVDTKGLEKPCEGFVDITKDDVVSKAAFESWYGKNASRHAECSRSKAGLVDTLRTAKIIK